MVYLHKLRNAAAHIEKTLLTIKQLQRSKPVFWNIRCAGERTFGVCSHVYNPLIIRSYKAVCPHMCGYKMPKNAV